jgi:S1-C subfamily serine protease
MAPILCILSLLLVSPAKAAISSDLVRRRKASVVNVFKSVINGLNVQAAGIAQGTGFIVDAKEGIIATNKHVAGTSPSQIKITFENGESTQARLLHYDAWHDFAFYKIEVEKLGILNNPVG